MAKKKSLTNSFEYKGCKVEIHSKDGAEELRIDEEKIAIDRDADTGAYCSPDLPYQVHGTPEEIAKAIVDTKEIQA